MSKPLNPAVAAFCLVLSAPAGAGDMTAHFAKKLNENTNWTDQARTASLCSHVTPKDLKPDVRDRCRDALEARAKADLESNPRAARGELEKATQMGLSAEKRQPIEASLRKAEKAAAEKQKKLAAKQKADAAKKAAADAKRMAAARKTYGETLRQKYLDDGLDIKVLVSGKDNRIITLKFALFNDVWANKMRKGDLINEIEAMGFKRLNMTDGYDYSVYWDLSK